jgi:hypothetical protein
VAAVVSVLAWRALALASGYWSHFAVVIALAIAWSMALAARRARGPRMQVMALVLTLASLGIGQYLVVNAMVHKLAAEQGRAMPMLVTGELFWRAWGQLHSARDWLFLAVGCGLAALVTRRPQQTVATPSDP